MSSAPSSSSSRSDPKPKPVDKGKCKAVASTYSYSYEPSQQFAAAASHAQMKIQRQKQLKALREQQLVNARDLYGSASSPQLQASTSSYLPSPAYSDYEAISIKSTSSSSSGSRSSRSRKRANGSSSSSKASSVQTQSSVNSGSIKSEQSSSTLVASLKTDEEDEVPLAVQLKTIRTERRPPPPSSSNMNATSVKSEASVVRGVQLVKARKKSLFDKFIDLFIKDEDCTPSSKPGGNIAIRNSQLNQIDSRLNNTSPVSLETNTITAKTTPSTASALHNEHQHQVIDQDATLVSSSRSRSIRDGDLKYFASAFDPKTLQDMEIDNELSAFSQIIEKYSSSSSEAASSSATSSKDSTSSLQSKKTPEIYNPHPDASNFKKQRKTVDLRARARRKAAAAGGIDEEHARLAEALLESMQF